MSAMPVLVAAAVVVRDGLVLLTRRPPRGHLASMWEFPGGKLEPNESPEAAVVRECREEIGVEVRPTDILDAAYHRYDDRTVLVLFYDCELVSGDVQHLGVTEHVWVRPADLGGYALPDADQNVVRKLMARG